MSRRLIAVYGVASLTVIVALSVGCGRHLESPAGPDTVAPSSVVVLSGRTGQPVPSLVGLTAVPGAPLNLQAPGFFIFRTAFAGSDIYLWPADDGFLTSHQTRSLVYEGIDGGKLKRLPPSITAVSLITDASIRATPWAMERIQRTAEILSRMHSTLRFDVDGAGFPFQLQANAADAGFLSNPGAAALTYTASDATGVISGVRIVFRSLQVRGFWHTQDNFQVAAVHECIHGTGLYHSNSRVDPPGIMMDSAGSYGFLEPTPQERIVMAMQYRRLPGTTLNGSTESDPSSVASSERGETKWRLVCARSR